MGKRWLRTDEAADSDATGGVPHGRSADRPASASPPYRQEQEERMMDLNRIRDLMIQVQDAGVTYIHFDYTLQYGQPKLNVYTPETGHNAFVSYDECVGHLEKLASKGEKGVAHQLAAKKLNELLAEKKRITKEIRDLHQRMEHVAGLPDRA